VGSLRRALADITISRIRPGPMHSVRLCDRSGVLRVRSNGRAPCAERARLDVERPVDGLVRHPHLRVVWDSCTSLAEICCGDQRSESFCSTSAAPVVHNELARLGSAARRAAAFSAQAS